MLLPLALSLGVVSGGLLSERAPSPQLHLVDASALEFVADAALGASRRELENMTLEELRLERQKLEERKPNFIPGAVVSGVGAALFIGSVITLNLAVNTTLVAVMVFVTIGGVAALVTGGIMLIATLVQSATWRRTTTRLDDRIEYVERHGLQQPTPPPIVAVGSLPPPPMPMPAPPPAPAPASGGALRIRVLSRAGAPLPNTAVELNGQRFVTDVSGMAWVDRLAAGPVMVKATAQGFAPAEEGASVVTGVTSELTITLTPSTAKLGATLSGQVRSAKGGKPLVATLEVLQLKQVVKCDENGAFQLSVGGGTFDVRISASGHAPQTRKVTVRDGDEVIFNVDLLTK